MKFQTYSADDTTPLPRVVSLSFGRRRALSGILPLLAVCLLANPATGHTQQVPGSDRVELPGNIRPVAPKGGASASIPAELSRSTLTAAEAAETIHLQVVLKMRRFEELQARVAAGEIISQAEMASRYLPLESDYQSVAGWLTAQGMSVAPAGASHAVVSASGTAAKLQEAFQLRFGRVTFQGTEYTAAFTAPSLPAEIEAHVTNVHGLQPYLHPHPSSAIRKAASTAAVTSNVAPPYLVSDILNAYNVSASGLTGAGQQIGIVIDTVPSSSDLTAFWSANGINQSLSNIVTVNVRGGTLPAPGGEETLDVSWSSGIAPAAQIIIYACGELRYVADAYNRILDELQDGTRPNLHQISMSYGAGEETEETIADMKSTNQLYTAICAYGVALFASSGDDGAYGNGGRTVQVLYPASDPNVTGVGGTSLYLNPATGAVTSETAWSPVTQSTPIASGGGTSSYFARPSWQVGNVVPTGTTRLVPDVALAADPNTGGYLVFEGKVAQFGGTSWAAPTWAALCALINQARAANGQTPLGMANSALYPLIGTSWLP